MSMSSPLDGQVPERNPVDTLDVRCDVSTTEETAER
jgi:hypothetical protein